MPFKLSMAAAMAASFALSVLAIPTILISKTLNLQPRAAESESYLCPDPAGFAAAKQALIGFGARPVDIAIAMLESGCAFTATYAAGNGKQAISSDAAELGVYHHNWYMLRTYYPGFQGAAEGDWFTRGQELQLVNPHIIPPRRGSILTPATATMLVSPRHASARCSIFSAQTNSTRSIGPRKPEEGPEYGRFVHQYQDFSRTHMNDGMALYWHVPSM